MKRTAAGLAAVLAAVTICVAAHADFVEDFHAKQLAVDPKAHTGWATLTGSGEAVMSFRQEHGEGVVDIDATKDRRNIWWAVIKRAVSPYLDRSGLGRKALRVEAKIRLNNAPRRVNLSLNHTRTTNFHADLAEFDIPDTGWHVISFTDKTFDAGPNDEIFAQLAMMDGGRQHHRIEIAYFKVTQIDAATAPSNVGNPMPYRPEMPKLASYANVVRVAEDGIVDSAYPWVNLRDWTLLDPDEGTLGVKVLSVSGSQMTILKFDLSRFKGRQANGWGVLELTTASAQWAPTNLEEFGYLRTVEIEDSAPDFQRDTVTWDSFFAGHPVLDVINGQLLYDVQPALQREGKTRILINPAALQRLIDGKSRGLAIYPQGALNAAFASSQAPDEGARPTLYFNVK